MASKLSRRTILSHCLRLPAGGALLFTLAACEKKAESVDAHTAEACANPDAMTNAQQSTRASLNYTEASTVSGQVCAGCSFFHAPASGACGTCDMFQGGPVNPKGRCDSWNAKG